jgi:hypothetical protein
MATFKFGQKITFLGNTGEILTGEYVCTTKTGLIRVTGVDLYGDKLAIVDYQFNQAAIILQEPVEAHGIKGMKGKPWRKTFKSAEALEAWVSKNDSVEVHGTRKPE